MAKYEIGQRVFAIRDADDDTVNLYGFGVYAGMFPAPGGLLPGHPNPRINLDTGETVWGFQCWWGPESRWESMRAGRAVVSVSPPSDEQDEP